MILPPLEKYVGPLRGSVTQHISRTINMKIEIPSVETLEEGDVAFSIHDAHADDGSVFVAEVSRWPSRDAAEEYMRFLRLEAEGLLSGTAIH